MKAFKMSIVKMNVPERDFGNILKSPQLGIFDFRAFLNLAMLIRESERARVLRQLILDIVIDTINQRTGGGTKYINQRDEDFLLSAFKEEDYRKEFTDALKTGLPKGWQAWHSLRACLKIIPAAVGCGFRWLRQLPKWVFTVAQLRFQPHFFASLPSKASLNLATR